MDYRERIQTSIEYIENNLSEKLLLENLAKQNFLSKYHYHRVFHELVGETVMAYIRKRRLTEAARELAENKVKVIDLALKYQFGSQEAFTRAFKRMFKVTPREFKRENIKQLPYKKIDLSHSSTAKQLMTTSIYKAA